MRSAQIHIIFALVLLQYSYLFCQVKQVTSIGEKYNVDIYQIAQSTTDFPETIVSLYEDPEGFLWILGSGEKKIIFNSNIKHQLYRFDGYNFTRIELPDDFSSGNFHFNGLKKINGNSFILDKIGKDISYIFNTETYQFTKIVDTNGATLDVGEVKTYGGSTYFSSTSFMQFILYELIDNVAHKRCAVDVNESSSFMPFILDGDHIVFSTSPSTPGIYKVNMKGELIDYISKERLGEFGRQLPSLNFVNSVYVNDKNYLGLRHTNVAPIEYTGTAPFFQLSNTIRLKENTSWVYSDSKGNVLAMSGNPPNCSDLQLMTEDHNVLLLDTILQFCPGVRPISSNDYSTHFYVSDGKSLFKINYTPKFSFIANDKVNARAITRLKDGSLVVSSETENNWYELAQNSEMHSFPRKLVPNLNLHTNRIFYQNANELWVNNISSLTCISNGEITREFELPRSYPESIISSPDGMLYLGYLSGEVYSFDTEKLQFQLINQIKTKNEENALIYDLEKIEDDLLLIGSENGLFLLNASTTLYEAIIDHRVLAIDKGKDGTIYYSDRDNHLYQFDQETHASKRLITAKAPIATITEDHKKRLWLGTFDGISVYDKKNGGLNSISNELLAHPEANRYSSYYDSLTNCIFIGSLSGVTGFRLEAYDKMDRRYQLHANKVTNHEGQSLITSNSIPEAFELPYDMPYIKINFSLDDPKNTKVTYRYKFEGDSDWKKTSAPGELELARLAPGKYELIISALDSNNNDSKNQLRFAIKVIDIFYKRWWFILLVIALLSSLMIYWFYRNKNERKRLEKEVTNRTKELQEEKEKIEQQSQQLKELDILKNQFFANVSHELRTPLTLILSPLEQLLKEDKLSGKQSIYLQLMQDNGKLLKDRIDELLELSRLEARKVTLQKQNIALDEIIDFSTRIFTNVATEKKINYQVKKSKTENISVLTDEKRLSKIIQNLINNAIKFTPKGGDVIAVFSVENQDLRIVVKDTGIGIPNEEKEKIFERFYQVKLNQVKANPGTGIGLAMVLEYVELMGGKIFVESQIMKGSTFSVTIPLEISEKSDLTSEIYDGISMEFSFLSLASQEKAHLLVVEDNADLRKYLFTLLSPYFNMELLSNGQLALDYLNSAERTPDIILSDIMMPEVDGITLLSRVRTDQRWKIIPFIFLTAKHNDADSIQAYKMGVDDYIKKPFSEEALLHRINAVYHNYKSRTQEFESQKLGKNEAFIAEKAVNSTLKIFVEIVQQELGKVDFSLDSVSEKMGISKRTLTRLLKKEIGISPGEYVKEFKLNTARKLLESQTDLPIKEIAFQVGFTDVRYFKQIYFKRYGERLR